MEDPNVIGAEDEEHVRFFAKHFIALCCYETVPTNDGTSKTKYCVFSAFVLSIQDEWFLIIAGHIFEGIEEAEALGCTFDDWQLDDLGAEGRQNRMDYDAPPPPDTIPFEFKKVIKGHYYNEGTGQDYAYFHLEAARYRAMLEKAGVVPLSEAAWRNGVPAHFERYMLLGIPTDQVQELLRPGCVSRFLVTLDVDPELTPQAQKDLKAGLLYGMVPDISKSGLDGFKSLEGMSGGPIFGFAKNKHGEHAYWIVAIQSSWREDLLRTTGYYVRPLALELEKMVLQNRDRASAKE